MNKPAPGDHESNFKKGVAIPNEPKTQLLEILMIGTYILRMIYNICKPVKFNH